MPHLLSRGQALDEIGRWLRPGDCLVCALLRSDRARVLERVNGVTVMLSSYPRFWGQVMICIDRHAEHFLELEEAEWHMVSEMSLKYARRQELELRPARVYVSALGSTQPLLQTCPHLHVNLLPVYDGQIKPASVFTWEQGVYAGTAAEWDELRRMMLK